MLLLAVITAVMAYKIPSLKLSYDYVEAVPDDDPAMIYYQQFKKQFGEDANVLVIGVQDSALYQAENFRRFKYFSDEVGKLSGVKYTVSLPKLQVLRKNTEAKQFELKPLFTSVPDEQAELDSLLQIARSFPLYANQLINPENGATLMLISVESNTLNSDKRELLVPDIQQLGSSFSEVTGIELHYAGIPFVRTVINGKIRAELQLFLILSVLVTALILWIFFRSWDAVVFPLVVIGVMVVWSVGTLAWMGYEITVLSGLLPPIIVIIGIPNSVYLINKYHQEYRTHGDKVKALNRIIQKIGMATLITNVTTAIGFLVLWFADISILEEFGIVAGVNILATFLVSIIVIPSVFSYLPPPSDRQLKHLRFSLIDWLLTKLDLLVHRHRYRVLGAAVIAAVIFSIGLLRIESVSYLVDGVPAKSQIKRDMQFFEDNFSGIMPLEIVVDTHKKRSATRVSTLRKVEELENYLNQEPAIASPISLAGFVKAARQAFYNGDSAFYTLPNKRDQAFVLRYLKNTQDSWNENANASSPDLLNGLADSTGQQVRISLRVADVGSNEIQKLVEENIRPKAEEIFDDPETDVFITGASLLFTKGNKFLIDNLLVSLLIAFGIIAVIMALLFGSVRMIFISLAPNVIPLIVTAGIMGFVGIPLKPSTAIIFSIVFGISVDDSIHFLAKYRQELKSNRFFVPIAISNSLRETGTSMIYTSIILFCGFIIFAGSSLNGTQYLGILTSLTLVIAMFTNLTVLPALLMVFDNGKGIAEKSSQPLFHLIEHYDEFYQEDEDEEIDLSRLQVVNQNNTDEAYSEAKQKDH